MVNKAFIDSFLKPQTTGNWILDLNPISKLIISILVGFSAIIAQSIPYSFALCLLYFILAAAAQKLRAFSNIYVKLMITVLLFLIILRQVTVKGDMVLFSIFGWNWTMEALKVGLNVSGYILGFSGAIILFSSTTSARDLMYSFERLGVPHTTSYVILASLQTIIDLNKSVKTIFESQKARGIEVEGNVFVRAKAFFPVISPLMLGAMSAAEEKSISMDARAFSLETQHTFLRELRKTPVWEKVMVAVFGVLFVALCVVRIIGIF